MSLVETIGDAVLYCGDCLEVLPTLGKVDAVITDPPYGIGFKYNEYVDDEAVYPEFMRLIVSATANICDGPFVFWQAMKNCDKWHEWFPQGFRLFAACKGFVQYRPTPVQYSWDPVVFWGNVLTEPSVYRKDFNVQNLAPFGANRERIEHPCPRPLEQVCDVLDTFTRNADLILDPFMGSGTTGVAALRLGRRFIGVEIEEKYYEIALKRIDREVRQGNLFTPPVKPKQIPLL